MLEEKPQPAPAKISYERLFNLGNYDHEKFVISKDVEAGTETEALQKLSVTLADLESDLKEFRSNDNRLDNLHDRMQWSGNTPEEKAKIQAEIYELTKRANAFRQKHKPVGKTCKCYFCTHSDDEIEEDEP